MFSRFCHLLSDITSYFICIAKNIIKDHDKDKSANLAHQLGPNFGLVCNEFKTLWSYTNYLLFFRLNFVQSNLTEENMPLTKQLEETRARTFTREQIRIAKSFSFAHTDDFLPYNLFSYRWPFGWHTCKF